MWKSEKNGLIVRQGKIEKPDRHGMFEIHGNGPLFWTETMVEFSLREQKSRDKLTVKSQDEKSSLF